MKLQLHQWPATPLHSILSWSDKFDESFLACVQPSGPVVLQPIQEILCISTNKPPDKSENITSLMEVTNLLSPHRWKRGFVHTGSSVPGRSHQTLSSECQGFALLLCCTEFLPWPSTIVPLLKNVSNISTSGCNKNLLTHVQQMFTSTSRDTFRHSAFRQC